MDTNISTINSTSYVPSAANLLVQYFYIAFGIAVLLPNLIIGLVLARNKEFLKKCAFITGMALGDTILGIGTLIAGILRFGYVQTNMLAFPVHPLYCLKTFTTWLLVAVQLPSILIVLMSSERVVAIVFFSWYYQNWNGRKAWYLVAAAIFCCTVSVSASWAVVYSFPANATTPINCGTTSAVGASYASYHFYLAACCGGLSTSITLCSLITFMNKRKKFQSSTNDNMKKHIKKEWQVTISTAVIAVLDLLLVVLPNILISLVIYYPGLQLLASYSGSLLALKSISNLFIYLVFNRDFRSKFLFFMNINGNNTVYPISKSTNIKLNEF